MGGILFIVEAPKKAKSIARYFSELTVKATVGHVVDLPVKEMGVSPPDHRPEYVTIQGKEKTIASLRKAANESQTIYIATDLDREGEAIAAHVNNLLSKKHAGKISRLTYSEVTQSAIRKAMQSPRKIRWALVRAQEARRVVDRYVGYLVSKALTQKIQSSLTLTGLPFLSAGRVQSIALKLIAQRDREIELFKPIQHYGVRAIVHDKKASFVADWVPDSSFCDKSGLVITSDKPKQIVASTHQLQHQKTESKRAAVLPPKPLTTDRFVQLCSGKLKITTKQAMACAQRLYEQGLITYHRTDSPVMSEEAVQSIRDYARIKKLPLPERAPQYSASASAQEAHECLRVSDIQLEQPNNLDGLDLSVYYLVWEVTLLSQLAAGKDDRETVWLVNEESERFRARGRTVVEMGWRAYSSKYFKVAPKKQNKDTDESVEQALPKIDERTMFEDVSLSLLEKHTKPPAVITEKTLVEQLVKLGVGRPSTYAQTIEKIVNMNYVSREAKTLRFHATALGFVVVDALSPCFAFMDEHYTAKLEADFDQIANGKANYLEIVNHAHQQLQAELIVFEQKTLDTKVEVSALASFCQSSNSKKSGKKTTGQGSSAIGDKKEMFKKTYQVGDGCPNCSKGQLVQRTFKNDPEKTFLGCNKFPNCRFFSWLSEESEQNQKTA